MPEAAPQEFGRYQLLSRMAAGGMAEIFRARVVGAHGFHKDICIKRILPQLASDPNFVSMFIDEAKVTAQLAHPKIVQVIDFGEVGGQYYIAMELVEGIDCLGLLRACAQLRVRLPSELAIHVVHETLDALDYAHSASDESGRPLGIVHRDVSPSNILVAKRGDVKLGDFGIARAAEQQTKTKAGTLKGKYGYMAPEQVIGGDVDARSDIFSAGIVLAEMLMGRRLFTSPNDLDVLLMVRDVNLSRLDQFGADIPSALRALIDRSLARDPAKRYQTAAEFRDALADYLFSLRRRVGASDLGSFVDKIGAQASAMPPGEGTGAGSAPKDRPRTGSAPKPGAPALRSVPEPPPGALGTAPTAVSLGGPQPRSKRLGGSSDIIITEAPPVATHRPVPSDPLIEVVIDPPAEAAPSAESADRGVFIDIGSQIEAELAGELEKERTPDSLAVPEPTPAPVDPDDVVGVEPEAPAAEGAFDVRETALRVFSNLAVGRETGLWRVESGSITKEIYLTDGVPVFVSSNDPRELFGQYLVGQGAISEAELAMALAMMPRFGGKLGDTLVGLTLLRPIEVFRYLTRQVREKLLDVFSWPEGMFRFYRGKHARREMFPLGLDAFELMGAASRALDDERILEYLDVHVDRRPRSVRPPRFPPERFRLGAAPRDLYDRLDGRRTTAEWRAQFPALVDQIQFGRTLFVLIETDLALLE